MIRAASRPRRNWRKVITLAWFDSFNRGHDEASALVLTKLHRAALRERLPDVSPLVTHPSKVDAWAE